MVDEAPSDRPARLVRRAPHLPGEAHGSVRKGATGNAPLAPTGWGGERDGSGEVAERSMSAPRRSYRPGRAVSSRISIEAARARS
jgi:hypothetical protein